MSCTYCHDIGIDFEVEIGVLKNSKQASKGLDDDLSHECADFAGSICIAPPPPLALLLGGG